MRYVGETASRRYGAVIYGHASHENINCITI